MVRGGEWACTQNLNELSQEPRGAKEMQEVFTANSVVLAGKNLPVNAGDIRDMDSVFGLGRSPGGGHGIPFQYSCLEILHGQRSLAGYGPYSHKESNTTEAT